MAKNRFKKGNSEWQNPKVKKHWFKKGQPKSENWKNKVLGRVPWNKGLKGFGVEWNTGVAKSNETKEKIRRAKLGKPGMKKEKNPNWKGGITRQNNQERTTSEYRLWVRAIFERDHFTCQKYGTKGGELVAHHINNFSQFPELRVAIDNGITLSKKAHTEFHKKYGRINNTREQLNEFLWQI